MKTILFCCDGEKISDFEINYLIDLFLSTNETEWKVSNHMVINELRARIAEKSVDGNTLEFLVEDLAGVMHRFNIDDNGRSSDWVDSQELYDDILNRLIMVYIPKK